MQGGMMNGGGMMQGTAVASFLPGEGKDLSTLPAAKPSETIVAGSGQTITLTAEIVRTRVNGRDIAMYAYNGEIPGPLITAKQGTSFHVHFVNNIDLPTTVHWHGLRLDSASDGVPTADQPAIEPGGTFEYTLTVPDEGIFWYHAHVREDIEQNMGLYGGILVSPTKPDAYAPANATETILVNDLLMDQNGPVPFGQNAADHVMMGRFGNTPFVNGSTSYQASFPQGSVVRFNLVNVANARPLKLTFTNAKMKLVGGDNGRYEHEQFVDSVILGPSERAIVDVLFTQSGISTFESATPVGTTVLGTVSVTAAKASPSYAAAFGTERTNADVIKSIDPFRSSFDKTPDETLHIVSSIPAMGQMMHGMDMTGPDGIEWEDSMAMMNGSSTKANTQWKLVDEATQATNDQIQYRFKKGDHVKIRIVNDTDSDHQMSHPIHFHGNRFLVLSDNGTANTNLVWKDSALVPTGHTVDILLDASNPGDWMFHCHIAEHLEDGMMGFFSIH